MSDKLQVEIVELPQSAPCRHCSLRLDLLPDQRARDHRHWMGKVSGLGVEVPGTSPSDAYTGAVIASLREVADRMERSEDTPNAIADCFETDWIPLR